MTTHHPPSLARTVTHPGLIDDLVSRILEAIYRRSYHASSNFAQFDKEIPVSVNPCSWLDTVGVMLIETERRQRMLAAILGRGERTGGNSL